MSDTQGTGQEAGEVYRFAIDFSVEDSFRALRYPLLRLEALLEPEAGFRGAQELTELGQTVIQGGDVEAVANRIMERQDASPLALTIASIVRADPRRKEPMLGAIFGAYAALQERSQTGGDPHARAVLGAIGGAVAATTYNELQKTVGAGSRSWQEWSEAE
jgi:hypothetical protein